MAEFAARGAVAALALFEVAMVWYAGVLRERFGWKSAAGNIVWFLLGCPGTVAIFFAQQVLYWKIASGSPFHDLIAAAAMVFGALVGLATIFYHVFEHSNKRKPTKE